MSGGGSVVTAGGRAAPGIGRERAGVQLHIPQMTGAPPPPKEVLSCPDGDGMEAGDPSSVLAGAPPCSAGWSQPDPCRGAESITAGLRAARSARAAPRVGSRTWPAWSAFHTEDAATHPRGLE